MRRGKCSRCKRVQYFPLNGWYYCSRHYLLICDQCWSLQPGMGCEEGDPPHMWGWRPCNMQEIPAGARAARWAKAAPIATARGIWHAGRPLVPGEYAAWEDPYLPMAGFNN